MVKTRERACKGAVSQKPAKQQQQQKQRQQKNSRPTRATTRQRLPSVLVCPNTAEKVAVRTASLTEITTAHKTRKSPSYATGSRSRQALVTVTSPSVRNQIYSDAAIALTYLETEMLPTYGGRPWTVTVRVADDGKNGKMASPFFCWRRRGGLLELATFPHFVNKIPDPPKFPKCTSDNKQSDGDDSDDEEDDDGDALITALSDSPEQEDRVHALLTRAYEDDAWWLSELAYSQAVKRGAGKGPIVPLPTVSVKWTSPLKQTFTTRKAAWEHAKQLATQECSISKVLDGLGANGKTIQPMIPTLKVALSTGQLRFERDGLWVVGQELSWQQERMKVLEELKARKEEQKQKAEKPVDDREKVFTTVLEYFLHCTRKEHRDERLQELRASSPQEATASNKARSRPRFTLRDAERELRLIWKLDLDENTRQYWSDKFTEFKGIQQQEQAVISESEDAPMNDERKVPAKASIELENAGKSPETAASAVCSRTPGSLVTDLEVATPALGMARPAAVSPDQGEKMGLSSSAVVALGTPAASLPLAANKQVGRVSPMSISDSSSALNLSISSNTTISECCGLKKPSPSIQPVDPAITALDHDPDGDKKPSAKASSAPLAVSASALQQPEQQKSSRLEKLSKRQLEIREKLVSSQLAKSWRLNPAQIKLCWDAGMEHFDKIMRTVKARDLTRELQDGFDLLRERCRGRYDMELPVFDQPQFSFLTNPKLTPWMPVVKQILGEDVILIHKGMFLSVPGAERQPYHQDGVHLTRHYQKPCHAINVFVPLLDLSLEHGPTEFVLGSHLLGNEEYEREFLETPTVSAGTPVIFDYRLGHRGNANNSTSARPIVYCTYARANNGKEFRDSMNFSRKRYRKIGDLVEKAPSRQERALKRARYFKEEWAVPASAAIPQGAVSTPQPPLEHRKPAPSNVATRSRGRTKPRPAVLKAPPPPSHLGSIANGSVAAAAMPRSAAAAAASPVPPAATNVSLQRLVECAVQKYQSEGSYEV